MCVAEPPFAAGSTVAIVGLGLMGGSLAAALKERRPDVRVVGCTRRPETLAEALQQGLIDVGCDTVAEAASVADLVVLATPVRTIVRLVPEAAAHLRAGAVLTDLGSTKRVVVAAMCSSAAATSSVGGHPMCGREQHGLAAADPHLYSGATWVICGGGQTRPEATARVAALASAVGARPLAMDAARHDAVVAATSHLPYAVAAALSRTVAQRVSNEELVTLSAGGYRDTTRVAASDSEMMLDILVTNKDETLPALRAMRCQLDRLIDLLEQHSGDDSALLAYMEEARLNRRLL